MPSENSLPQWARKGSSRRWWIVGFFALLAVTGIYIVHSAEYVKRLGGRIEEHPLLATNETCRKQPVQKSFQVEPWLSPSNSLNNPNPTTFARDNLRNDSYYITGFGLAGYTNEFINYMHMIYLGVLSGRIPIIPPIIPAAHVTQNAGLIRFGSIYNLTTLRRALRRPILEWSDVKTFDINGTFTEDREYNKPTDPNIEYFGCWSVSMRDADGPVWVQGVENTLKLDMSFTRAPDFAYFQKDKHNPFTVFSALASLILPKHGWFNDGPQKGKWPPTIRPSRLGKELHPDDQLACFDTVYYMTSGVQGMEFEQRWSQTWHRVGKHLRFNEDLVNLARDYVRRTMKVEEVPPIITVHIRRGDFNFFGCKERDNCYIAIPKYHEAVTKMQAQLLKDRNVTASRVLVSSDETDPAFWKQMADYGWDYLNHTAERTEERYGEWYSLLIDKVSLSLGSGFVGTVASTFSTLNAWRVEDWNGGLSHMTAPWS